MKRPGENRPGGSPFVLPYHSPFGPALQAFTRSFPVICLVLSLFLPATAAGQQAKAKANAKTKAQSKKAAEVPTPPFHADAPATPARPNILFIYTDDQAPWTMGCYGRTDTLTPNLNRLAAAGMRFDNAFTTTPVCSPSRAGLISSLYSTQVKIRDWLNPSVEPNDGLAPATITWPELLKSNGYKTFLAGKWHLGLLDQFHPRRSGFDQFFGFRGGGNSPLNPTLENEEGITARLEGNLANMMTDHTLQFIRQNKDNTWLAALHFREPHAPYVPTAPEDLQAVSKLEIKLPDYPGLPLERMEKLRRDYLAAVHAVDRNVGRVLDLLDELKLNDDTLGIFTSDHGYMIGEHGLHHKGNASWMASGHTGPRPNMFDYAIRVPLLVRQPSRIAAGSTSKRTLTQLDIYPTILSWMGLALPPNLKLQGRDASVILQTGSAEGWDDTYFGQYDMKHYKEAHMRTLRRPDWKLIRHLEPGESDELYDLKNDPEETRNLASDDNHKTIRHELNDELVRRMKAIDDPLAGQAGK
ncbi:MAG: sulfatase [bacterium]